MQNVLKDLKIRPFDEDVSEDILKFETEFSLKLPTAYRLFYETYWISRDETYNRFYYQDGGRNRFLTTENIFQPTPDLYILVDDMCSLEEIKIALKGYEGEFIENDLLPISFLSNDTMLVVGLNSANSDNVYHVDLDKDDDSKITKLADNIFHFFRGYFSFESAHHASLYSRLYKNWGEAVWNLKS